MASSVLSVDYACEGESAERMFRQLAEFTGKTIPELIRAKAGLMARYLAERTMPVAGISNENIQQNADGGSLKARDLGRGAVRRDLARVYIAGGKAASEIRVQAPNLIRAYWYCIKQGRFAEAERISKIAGIPLTVSDWDNGERHRRLRNNRGRVNRSNSPEVINDTKALKAYQKAVEQRVGWAKAAWINAGRQIDPKASSRVRGWIKNLTESPGSGQDLTNDTARPRIILTNLVKYASQAMSAQQFARTMQAIEDAIEAEMKAKLAALAARAARDNRPTA